MLLESGLVWCNVPMYGSHNDCDTPLALVRDVFIEVGGFDAGGCTRLVRLFALMKVQLSQMYSTTFGDSPHLTTTPDSTHPHPACCIFFSLLTSEAIDPHQIL